MSRRTFGVFLSGKKIGASSLAMGLTCALAVSAAVNHPAFADKPGTNGAAVADGQALVADIDEDVLDPKTASELRALLASKDKKDREAALRRLSDLGSGVAPFVPQLITVLDGIDDEDRLSAVLLITQAGPAGKSAVPILITTLEDKQGMRDRAIAALAAIGPEARDAVPGLLKILQGGNTTSGAEVALAAIGPAAIPAVLGGLDDKDPDCRRLCITALRDMRERPDYVIPSITKMVSDKQYEVAREALWALAKIGQPAKAAVPDLISVLKNKDPYLRQFSADALGAMGPCAKEALPLLNKSLSDATVKPYARAAIKKIELGQVQ